MKSLQTAYAEMKLQNLTNFLKKLEQISKCLLQTKKTYKITPISYNQKIISNLFAINGIRLTSLIGSSDGKKYRNFAQALTFEHLIGLANKQLRKMSDRYILKRTGDAFVIRIVGNRQFSKQRRTHRTKIFRGEKFIVSLSLACSLSNMASRNICR